MRPSQQEIPTELENKGAISVGGNTKRRFGNLGEESRNSYPSSSPPQGVDSGVNLQQNAYTSAAPESHHLAFTNDFQSATAQYTKSNQLAVQKKTSRTSPIGNSHNTSIAKSPLNSQPDKVHALLNRRHI